MSTAQAISEVLSAKGGKPLPWSAVRAAIDGAFQGRLLERSGESGPWPCDYARATQAKLKVRRSPPPTPTPTPTPTRADVLIATAYLNTGQVQDLADQIGDIGNAAVGYDMKGHVRVEVGGDGKRPPVDVVAKINAKLGEVSRGFKPG